MSKIKYLLTGLSLSVALGAVNSNAATNLPPRPEYDQNRDPNYGRSRAVDEKKWAYDKRTQRYVRMKENKAAPIVPTDPSIPSQLVRSNSVNDDDDDLKPAPVRGAGFKRSDSSTVFGNVQAQQAEKQNPNVFHEIIEDIIRDINKINKARDEEGLQSYVEEFNAAYNSMSVNLLQAVIFSNSAKKIVQQNNDVAKVRKINIVISALESVSSGFDAKYKDADRLVTDPTYFTRIAARLLEIEGKLKDALKAE